MLVPATCYVDCEAALAFLRDVLELKELAVYRDEADAIVHAEMGLGTGVLMFSPYRDDEFGRFMAAPSDLGQRETTTVYGIVTDVAGLYERVTAKGAEIVLPLRAEAYGGVSFTVRDPEGHLWTFGDYTPADP